MSERASIIETVKSPIGFFTLVVLVVEGGLVAAALTVGSVDPPLRANLLYICAGIIVLLVFSIVLMRVLRVDIGDSDLEAFGFSIASEIYSAFDPLVSNLPEEERHEAYLTLFTQLKAGGGRDRKLRDAIMNDISTRARISLPE